MARRGGAAGSAALTLLALLLAAATLSAAADVTTATGASRKGAYRKDYLPANPFCPWDAVKFAACAGVLGAVGAQAGGELLGSKCCNLVGGLTAAEAAACLCVTGKEAVLGIPVDWTVGVGLIVSTCKDDLPDGFKCV